MAAHRPAPVDLRYDLLGRLGSWHSRRPWFFLAGVAFYLMAPFDRAPAGQSDDVLTANLVVGLLWALPVWLTGVTARRSGVWLHNGLFARRIRWTDIDRADVAWHHAEPRLCVTRTDGERVWAPGFDIPISQRSPRQDGWRGTEMFSAAELITAEAERRRSAPRGGIIHPVPARRRLGRPAAARA